MYSQLTSRELSVVKSFSRTYSWYTSNQHAEKVHCAKFSSAFDLGQHQKQQISRTSARYLPEKKSTMRRFSRRQKIRELKDPFEILARISITKGACTFRFLGCSRWPMAVYHLGKHMVSNAYLIYYLDWIFHVKLDGRPSQCWRFSTFHRWGYGFVSVRVCIRETKTTLREILLFFSLYLLFRS